MQQPYENYLLSPISQIKELKLRELRHLLDQGHKRVRHQNLNSLTPKLYLYFPLLHTASVCSRPALRGPQACPSRRLNAHLKGLFAQRGQSQSGHLSSFLSFVFYSATPLHLPYSPFSLSKKTALWLILLKGSPTTPIGDPF